MNVSYAKVRVVGCLQSAASSCCKCSLLSECGFWLQLQDRGHMLELIIVSRHLEQLLVISHPNKLKMNTCVGIGWTTSKGLPMPGPDSSANAGSVIHE